MFQDSGTHITRPRYRHHLVRTFIPLRKYVLCYMLGYGFDRVQKELPIPKLREQLSIIPFVPVKSPKHSSSEPSPEQSPIEYFPPNQCFITSPDTEEHEHYRSIFPFVDFGQNGNSFLESCCAKKSPDAPDIIRKIVQNPQRYLKALRNDTNL